MPASISHVSRAWSHTPRDLRDLAQRPFRATPITRLLLMSQLEACASPETGRHLW